MDFPKLSMVGDRFIDLDTGNSFPVATGSDRLTLARAYFESYGSIFMKEEWDYYDHWQVDSVCQKLTLSIVFTGTNRTVFSECLQSKVIVNGWSKKVKLTDAGAMDFLLKNMVEQMEKKKEGEKSDEQNSDVALHQ